MKQAAVILTGGKSSRMGSDKSLLKIGDKTFIEVIYSKLKQTFETVILSVNKKGKYDALDIDPIEIEDIYKDIGPIGGIYSVFKQTDFDSIFVVSVDAPFISNVVALEIMKIGIGYDICMIEREDSKLEPLFACYNRTCLPYLEKLINAKNYKMVDLCKMSNVKKIEQCKLEALIGEKSDSNFINLNTMNDYKKYISNEDITIL